MAASAAKYREKGLAAIGKSFGKGLGRIWEGFGRFWKKLNFQAVIKSAASAASGKTKNQGPRSRGAHGRRLGLRTTGLGGSPGSWSLIFGLPGGCASSRLDHGLKFYADWGITGNAHASTTVDFFFFFRLFFGFMASWKGPRRQETFVLTT